MMTLAVESATPPPVGRKKRWHETMLSKFPQGTFERIANVLAEGEVKTDFIRAAVERELKRRERKPKRRPRRRDDE